MSAPLIRTLAGLIPWADIVKATPSIISAARGAFDSRGAKPEPVATNAERITEATPTDEAIDFIREDIALLRNAITELQEENSRKSRLLGDLLEQNSKLSESLLKTRIRLRLTVICALAGLAAGLGAIWMVVR
ncbi:MAG: hypothetical protein ACYC9O_17440 [Candidatus Latescibacterota bacterium]